MGQVGEPSVPIRWHLGLLLDIAGPTFLLLCKGHWKNQFLSLRGQSTNENPRVGLDNSLEFALVSGKLFTRLVGQRHRTHATQQQEGGDHMAVIAKALSMATGPCHPHCGRQGRSGRVAEAKAGIKLPDLDRGSTTC